MSTAATRYTCPRYAAIGGQKRCRSYLDGGGCSRPEIPVCTEWLKVNGGPALAPTDLFGRPLPAPAPRTPATRSKEMGQVARAPSGVPEALPLTPLTPEQIDAFKALGAEICLRSARAGTFWLVPEYTGADRAELAPEHAQVIAAICQAFVGAQVSRMTHRPG